LAGNLPKFSGMTPGDDLNWLYGYGTTRVRYVQDLKTFICPSTQDYVRTNMMEYPFASLPSMVMVDLLDNGRLPARTGHSYEVLSYWVRNNTIDKTLQSTATFKKIREPLAGTVPGPAMILLIHDAMDNLATNNYPNPDEGHGADGGNMLFADGHAEWIDVKNWAYRWAVSQDSTMAGP
jgi:prepilin-type processing-associated H-X9-DG protein